MNYCKQCGQKLSEGAKFCGSCGTQVDGAEQVPAAAMPQVQETIQTVKNAKIFKPRMNAVLAFIVLSVLCYGVYAVYQKENQPSPIIGSWQEKTFDGGNASIAFFSDGKVMQDGSFGRYTIKNGNYIIIEKGNSKDASYRRSGMYFSIDDDTLTLKNEIWNIGTTYIRVK